MKGVRILLGFVGVGWVLGGVGAGVSAIEYGAQQSDSLQREWDRTAAEYDRDLQRAQAEVDQAGARFDARLERAKATVDDWQSRAAAAPDSERTAKKLEDAKAALAEEQSRRDDAVAAAKARVDELAKEKQSALARLQSPAQSLGLWDKIGPFLGAFLGVLMVIAAIALGFLRPAGASSAEWTSPAEPTADPEAQVAKPAA